MRVNKNSVLFYGLTSLLTIFMFILNDISVSIISFILFNILYYILHDFDIVRPDCWFIPIYSLYSIAFATVYMLGEYSTSIVTNEHLIISWIGLLVLCVCITKQSLQYEYKDLEFKIDKKIVFLAVLFIVVVILLYDSALYNNPVYRKIDVVGSTNPIIILGNIVLPNVSLFFILIMFITNLNKKTKIYIFLVMIGLLILTFLINGDRSLVIKNIISGVLIYRILIKKISFKKAAAIGVLALLAITIMSPLKMFLVRQNDKQPIHAEDDKSVVVKLLESDFHAAGLNLNTLVVGKDRYELKYGETWIYDFIRPFDMILPININSMSSLNWYQNLFYPNKVTGMGFTLTGEGYVNFGVLGIIIQMLFVSGLLNFIYKMSNKSGFLCSLYICLVPIFMYANRADLANILSPLVKMIIPLFIFYSFTNKRKV